MMDESLAAQLGPWPNFHKVSTADPVFANHCYACGAPQDDMYLHSEPEQPFFDVPAAIMSGSVTLTPLVGTLRLNGDEHFRID